MSERLLVDESPAEWSVPGSVRDCGVGDAATSPQRAGRCISRRGGRWGGLADRGHRGALGRGAMGTTTTDVLGRIATLRAAIQSDPEGFIARRFEDALVCAVRVHSLE